MVAAAIISAERSIFFFRFSRVFGISERFLSTAERDIRLFIYFLSDNGSHYDTLIYAVIVLPRTTSTVISV